MLKHVSFGNGKRKEEREKGMGQSMGKTEGTGDRAKENKKGKGRKMEWGWERGK